LPNEHIRSIKSYLNPSGNESDLWVIRIDIKAFYDQICHEQLFELLKTQVPDERVLGLLRRAVRTPTVPLASTRGRGRGRNPVGVPQGLAISNALANTYLASFDQAMLSATRFYLRYVDDILIICEKHEVPVIVAEMNRELDRLGLAPNTEKSRSASLSSPFEYLGYAIKWPLISVRRSTVDRYLRGLAAIITTFKYRLRYGRFPAFLSPDVARLVLVEELNEKITGAISGARRYGWLFYFAELNDRTLLYSIDAFVRRLLAGLPEFRQKLPSGLKRLSRAHFEVLHNQTGGYILDYNAFSTIKQRLDFLLERGRIDPADAERLSTLEVNRIFESYRHSRLSSLERDVGFVS
jgi:hypothetical protein